MFHVAHGLGQELKDGMGHFLLASDGIWEFMKNEDVAEIVHRCLFAWPWPPKNDCSATGNGPPLESDDTSISMSFLVSCLEGSGPWIACQGT